MTETTEVVDAEEQDDAAGEALVASFKFPEENWTEIAGNPDEYPARKTLLAPLVLAYQEAESIRAKYLAVTDIEQGVAAYIASNDSKEFAELRKQIEQAELLIAKNKATMEAKARAELMATVDPDFDEAKTVAKYNDLKSVIKTDGKELVPLFRKLNHIDADVSESGAAKNLRPATDYGYALLTVMDLPKLTKDEKSGSTTAVDPAVTARNKAAKAWGAQNGWAVKDKGRPEVALLEAFAAAGSPGLTA